MTHEQLLLLLGGITALLAVLGPIMTTMGAAIGSWVTARRAAKRDDLDDLRREVKLLQARLRDVENENHRLHQENLILREYIVALRIKLKENGIEVPPLGDINWKIETE